MKTYRIDGIIRCETCGNDADYYVDVLHVSLCKRCALELYRSLGERFIPKAVPNMILRAEGKYKTLDEAIDISAEEIVNKSKNKGDTPENTRRNKWQSFKTKSSEKSSRTSRNDRKHADLSN